MPGPLCTHCRASSPAASAARRHRPRPVAQSGCDHRRRADLRAGRVRARPQILNLLSDLKKSLGLSLVFISHDIQTVRYVSDEIVVMNHGTIVERGALTTC
ncbi:MAG: hypothetical protein ACLTDO_07120 [Bifidobacterium pseudocatenulatum]